MTKPILWFAGTPEFAAYSLEALIKAGYDVQAVLTQPDRPAGRGQKTQASAIKSCALAHQIALEQPEKLQAAQPPFAQLPRPDLVVVVAYGLLLPRWFLEYPRLGCINVHASLLPRWRGAAPIQRAIEAGDSHTGIGIMQMDEGLDTGAVWLEKRLPIGEDDAQSLHQKLMHLGAETLLEALPNILAQQGVPQAQSTQGITYAAKLRKQEAAINWQAPAQEIVQKIRAFNSFPVAYTHLEGQNLRIYRAERLHFSDYPPELWRDAPIGKILAHQTTGLDVKASDGIVRIHRLQFPGKNPTTAEALCHGRNLTGKIFS